MLLEASTTLDEVIENAALHGEMGAVGELLSREHAMNEKSEKVLAQVLNSTATIREHLEKGLPAMLKANGSPLTEAVQEFLRPALVLMDEVGKDVAQFVQREERAGLLVSDTFTGQATQLEAFADEFERLANTVAQWKLAAKFKEFVAGTARTTSKEPAKDRDIERG